MIASDVKIISPIKYLAFISSYSLECFFADINAAWRARRLGTTGQIHCIPKETITRHAITNNTGDNFARMNTNGNLLCAPTMSSSIKSSTRVAN